MMFRFRMDIKTALIILSVGATTLFGQDENTMIVEMKTGVSATLEGGEISHHGA